MPLFEYTALTGAGREERGTIDAGSVSEARRRLREARVHVVELREDAARASSAATRTILARRVRPGELAVATRQLATLLGAGMPLVPALTALAEQCADEPIGKTVSRVRDRVNEGAPLWAALGEHPHVFSELYVNMVRAGETAGALDGVLERLAETTEKRAGLRTKVRAALAYPALMVVVGTGVVMFLLAFVIPSLARLFVQMNRALPWPTVALMRVSGFVSDYLLGIVVGAVVLVVALRVWAATPRGRAVWDRLKLRLPLFGDLAMKAAVARIARTLGVLLDSGVAILDALDIAGRLAGNAALAEALAEARDSVRHGGALAAALRRGGVFPPIVVHMTAAGEASGRVAEGLLHVADAYDSEVEAKVGAITSLIEPLLILALGVVVGFIVLAILLPIFDINQAIL